MYETRHTKDKQWAITTARHSDFVWIVQQWAAYYKREGEPDQLQDRVEQMFDAEIVMAEEGHTFFAWSRNTRSRKPAGIIVTTTRPVGAWNPPEYNSMQGNDLYRMSIVERGTDYELEGPCQGTLFWVEAQGRMLRY